MEKGGIYNRENWKKLLRAARNRRTPHMPMELMNLLINITPLWPGSFELLCNVSVNFSIVVGNCELTDVQI